MFLNLKDIDTKLVTNEQFKDEMNIIYKLLLLFASFVVSCLFVMILCQRVNGNKATMATIYDKVENNYYCNLYIIILFLQNLCD